MKTMIRRGLTSSYTLYREYRLLRLALDTLRRRDPEPILVYQMGKVGSTSVTHAVTRACPSRQVLHLHTLEPDRLAREEEVYRRHFPQRRNIDRHLLDGLFVRRRLAGWLPRPKRWKILTLVRDPVARNLSTFFQTLDLHFAHLDFAERIRGGDERVLEELVAFFREQFPHERVLSWFDDEIRAVFGIDVLDGSFRPDAGYGLYSTPRADVLLLRLEDIDRCAPAALGELLGVEHFELNAVNVGSDKYYAGIYRDALRRTSLPEALLDRIYGSKMVRALYTPDEISAFRARWTDLGTD